MSPHAQVTIHDLRGPLGEFLTVLATAAGRDWFEAFKKFLRKENPWGTDNKVLLDIMHCHGWSDEEIGILCKGTTLSELRRRMFPTPVLDKAINEVFTRDFFDRMRIGSGLVRILNALQLDRVETVRELVVLTERQVLNIPHLGKKNLVAIKEVLMYHGLHLGMQLD